MATKKHSKKTARKKIKKIKKQQKKTLRPKPKKTAKRKTLKPSARIKKPLKAKAKKPAKIKKTAEDKAEAIRKSLIQRREDIVKEAKTEISKYIKGENRQLVDTAIDDGDWSVVDLSEDVSLRKLGTHRETLLKIDAALRKLEEGTYGRCEDCGEMISPERLKVLPFAIYCRDCQEKIEQLEAIEKTM